MDLSHLFSRHHHRACKWLGSKDWLRLIVNDSGIEYQIERNLYQSEQDRDRFDPADFANAQDLLNTYASSNAACCFFLNMFSKMLADGPKLYLPTLDHCLAMENTEVNVPFADYRQPYPVTLIELPLDYQDHIRKEFNTKHPPKYVLCQRYDCGVISAAAWFDPNNTVVNTLAPLDKFKTVEDAILANQEIVLPAYGEVAQNASDEDFKVADLVQRLALNFSFFMTIHGMRVVGPLHQQRHLEMLKIVKNSKANPNKVERAKNYFVAPVFVVDFNQKLKFYEVQDESPNESEETVEGRTHRSPKPHWRKGHYRKQKYGPQLSLWEYRYINPIMVMKRFFVGDKADTSVVYSETKKPGAPDIKEVLSKMPRRVRGRRR